MTQNGQNQQYSNEKRKRKNKINLIFTICVITAVAIAASGILVAMALSGRPAVPAQSGETSTWTQTSQIESEASGTGSMTVSQSAGESSPSDSQTSSTVSDISLQGKTTAIEQNEDPLLVLVNNTTPLPEDFKSNLTTAFDAKIDKRMVEDFEALYSAGAEHNCYYWITYGYRSEKDQNTLYNDEVESLMEEGKSKKEAQTIADKTIQKGGASEYVTGLSIGVNTGDQAFGKTEEGKWLEENSYKYGFVLRFPKDKEAITGVEYQPWRYRYVGRTHAKKMHELNMCLEEYVMYLNNGGDTASSTSNSEVASSETSK